MTAPFSVDNAAMLIDHQVGTIKLILNLPLDDVRRFTLALAKAAAILKMPVVLTSSQEDRMQAPLMPELAALLPEAYVRRVQRQSIVNAWADLAFKLAVQAPSGNRRSRDIRQPPLAAGHGQSLPVPRASRPHRKG